MRIGVIGVGSIGSVLAKGFDRLGHDVVINDIDKQAVADLPFEARPKRWIAMNCDVAVFALPTPTTETGGDASFVDEALTEFQGANAVCVLRSTMPPGSTRQLAEKHDLDLVYSPEFLRDRSGVEDFFNPDRIVISGPEEAREPVRKLFSNKAINCETIIETGEYLTAEIGKEAHNAFFATKVSFANQMRIICEREGADAEMVQEIITADHRNTTSHMDPMLGAYGGKCLPKDTEALTHYGRQQRAAVPLLEGVIETNNTAREKYENVTIEGQWPNITVTSN